MLPHKFISEHSRILERILEHRFIYDLSKQLLLEKKPRILNVLRSEVDAFGFDMVLSTTARTVHIQMKTRSGKKTGSPFRISNELWTLPNAYIVWMLYSSKTLEPTGYFVFDFKSSRKTAFRAWKKHSNKRSRYRRVKMRDATHQNIGVKELADILLG